MYMVIGAVVVIALVLIVVLMKKKGGKAGAGECPVDLTKLFDALGGKDNVQSVEAVGSKVRTHLADVSAVDAGAIKALGASGIVVTGDKATMIFGKASTIIADFMARELG